MESEQIKKISEIMNDGNSVFENVSSAINIMSIAQPVLTLDYYSDVVESWNEMFAESIDYNYAVITKDDKAAGYIALHDGDLEQIEYELMDAYSVRRCLRDENIPETFNNLVLIKDLVIGDCSYPINSETIFVDTTPLLELFSYFPNNAVAFVLSQNKINHIVEASDMDSMPVKLTLFALLLELEEKMKLLLEQQPNLDSYINMLSAKSLERITRFAKMNNRNDTIAAKEMLAHTTLNEKHFMLKEHVMTNKKSKILASAIEPIIKQSQELRNMIAHGNPQALKYYSPVELKNTIDSILFLVKIVYDLIDFKK